MLGGNRRADCAEAAVQAMEHLNHPDRLFCRNVEQMVERAVLFVHINWVVYALNLQIVPAADPIFRWV